MISQTPQPLPLLKQQRSKSRKYFWIAVLIAFLVWFFIPRPLSSETKQQLAMIGQLHSTPSKAFTYLIGMQAPDNVDPMIYGQQILPRYLASSNLHYEDSGVANSPANPYLTVDVFKGTPFVSYASRDSTFVDAIFTNATVRKTVLLQSAQLLNRYQTYKTLGDFHQPYKASLSNLIAPYQLLISGQKLLFLQQIDQVENHQITPQIMQQNILADLNHWRSELTTSDSLIDKMVKDNLLKNDLIMLSTLYIHYGIHAPTLMELTDTERSLDLAKAAEIEGMYQILTTTNQEGDLLCFAKHWRSCIERAAFFFEYDANDTVNMYTQAETMFLKYAAFPLPVTAQHESNLPKNIGVTPSRVIRNMAGIGLAQFPFHFNLIRYVYRIDDTNLQITLLNATANQSVGKSDSIWLQSIANPYGADVGHAYLNTEGWLCLPTPLKEETSPHPLDGCIPWKAS